ncbi:hypothetical protein [Sporolactobacillus laevolacticus]|jgi:uncharacterized protein YoxC|uniref:hypothetical protein n=1 Tax=Sporolactobacillus laevolacticus TaxID=33018 RepID=UPI0025B44BA9|nr:hypothetical protein [Sporolactobacillus laevolacticus]MDF2911226.1 hypothetical protein [Sporolactobacillus laevolacticus]MDN3954255.1 hypothetical protein [Sporolactobacillus laevolacticus]
MIIVYLSLVLVVASIIVFVVSAANTLKLMNGSLAKISKTGAKLRRQSEEIISEKNELTRNFSLIQLDISKNKDKVQETVRQAGQSVLLAQVAFCKGKALLKKDSED